MLPKGMIINNIVETLKRDPENGVVKLLETAKNSIKTSHERAMVQQVINYYSTSPIAKMQIRNLVLNTSKPTLAAFSEYIYDALSKKPISLHFLKLITTAQADTLKQPNLLFPVIDLKNLSETTKEVLAKLKNNGHIFFVSISVTEENFDIVTSNEVTILLIKHGVRAILYRTPATNSPLEAKLAEAIHQVRTTKPILAFFMRKKEPLNSASFEYVINENVNGNAHSLTLDLR